MQERDIIRIRGARENNLKDVSLDIPKYKITVFTGVSVLQLISNQIWNEVLYVVGHFQDFLSLQ